MRFYPDYKNIVDAASNRVPKRIPMYDHLVADSIMEDILGYKFGHLYGGSLDDKRKYFKSYCDFWLKMGYDTVTFEGCIGAVMPGSGSLGRHKPGEIKDREDFNRYPWESIPGLYKEKFYEDYNILRDTIPEGMRCIGGPGNGIFECVQEIVGYESLCYIKYDDEALYKDLFDYVGRANLAIWTDFMKEFNDLYCVLRFGDDLGYKSSTMLPAEDVKAHICTNYKPIVDLVHSYDKPFLLHSCGNIASVMEHLIEYVGIDAKHSNEDQIAPYSFWVETYGDRIGNFGGIDTDLLCRADDQTIIKRVEEVFDVCKGKGGFAVGTGNSVPDYVDVKKYLVMVDAIHWSRGE